MSRVVDKVFSRHVERRRGNDIVQRSKAIENTNRIKEEGKEEGSDNEIYIKPLMEAQVQVSSMSGELVIAWCCRKLQ